MMGGKHKMPDGSMMEDSEMEEYCPPAELQAGALEAFSPADASIQSLHKKLAAAGAAAAQPTSSQSFDSLVESSLEDDYSGVEMDEPDFEPV